MLGKEPTWYLLYDGSSTDGRGTPDYVGRTTDKSVAEKHANRCSENPYCTGYVLEVSDSKAKRLTYLIQS